MQFLTTMKLPFSVYSNRALTIVSKETGETESSWSIRHFWDTPHFWGSTQTFYVVFIPARQKCGVSLCLRDAYICALRSNILFYTDLYSVLHLFLKARRSPAGVQVHFPSFEGLGVVQVQRQFAPSYMYNTPLFLCVDIDRYCCARSKAATLCVAYELPW